VTATLATFFIGRDAENDEAELAGAKQLAALREEVIALRGEIRRTTAADAIVVKRDSVEEPAPNQAVHRIADKPSPR